MYLKENQANEINDHLIIQKISVFQYFPKLKFPEFPGIGKYSNYNEKVQLFVYEIESGTWEVKKKLFFYFFREGKKKFYNK